MNTGQNILTEPRSILKELKRFYMNLYKSSRPTTANTENQFLNANLKALDQTEKQLCKRLTTKDEVKTVLKAMANCKSSGSDGYSAKFYKFFWNDIGEYLLESLNKSFQVGELSQTQEQGIIILLPKADKPHEFIKNW